MQPCCHRFILAATCCEPSGQLSLERRVSIAPLRVRSQVSDEEQHFSLFIATLLHDMYVRRAPPALRLAEEAHLRIARPQRHPEALDGRAVGAFVFEVRYAHLHVYDRLRGKARHGCGPDVIHAQHHRSESFEEPPFEILEADRQCGIVLHDVHRVADGLPEDLDVCRVRSLFGVHQREAGLTDLRKAAPDASTAASSKRAMRGSGSPRCSPAWARRW